jgi:hypothetical protein
MINNYKYDATLAMGIRNLSSRDRLESVNASALLSVNARRNTTPALQGERDSHFQRCSDGGARPGEAGRGCDEDELRVGEPIRQNVLVVVDGFTRLPLTGIGRRWYWLEKL